MRKIVTLTIIVIVGFLSTSSAQLSELKSPSGEKLKLTNSWSPLLQLPNLGIEYKLADCNDQTNGINNEYVALQFINPSKIKIIIEWDMVLWYNNKCINCNADIQEMHRTLTLDPGATLLGDCTNRRNQSLNIFSRSKNAPNAKNKLTFFEVKNLKIRTLE